MLLKFHDARRARDDSTDHLHSAREMDAMLKPVMDALLAAGAGSEGFEMDLPHVHRNHHDPRNLVLYRGRRAWECREGDYLTYYPAGDRDGRGSQRAIGEEFRPVPDGWDDFSKMRRRDKRPREHDGETSDSDIYSDDVSPNPSRLEHGGDRDEDSDDDDLPPLEPVQETLFREAQVTIHPLISYDMF